MNQSATNITLSFDPDQMKELRHVHAAMSIIYMILGVSANVGILVIIKKYQRHNEIHTDTIIVANLFINNLLISVFVMMTMAMNALFFHPHSTSRVDYLSVCNVQLYAEYSLLGTEYVILITIAGTRYCMIIHHAAYQRIFSKPSNVKIILIFCWTLFPIVFIYHYFLPSNHIRYDPLTSACDYDNKNSMGFYLSTATFLVSVPIILFLYIAICYKIFHVKWKTTRGRKLSNGQSDSVKFREKWFVLTIICLFTKILITYLPYFIMTFVYSPSVNQNYKADKHIVFLYIRYSNIFTNALAYAFFNTNMRNTILKYGKCCKSKVDSSNEIQSGNKINSSKAIQSQNDKKTNSGSQSENNENDGSRNEMVPQECSKKQTDVVLDNEMRRSSSSSDKYYIKISHSYLVNIIKRDNEGSTEVPMTDETSA